jgi:hypothetical protein
MEFSFEPKTLIVGSLVLYAEGDEWTDDYRALTRDFYLKA